MHSPNNNIKIISQIKEHSKKYLKGELEIHFGALLQIYAPVRPDSPVGVRRDLNTNVNENNNN